MNTQLRITRRRSAIAIGLLAIVSLAASPAEGGDLPSLDDSAPLGGAKGVAVETPAAPGRWTFSAGPVWRRLGDVRFHTGITPGAIPPLFGSNSFTEPPGIGPDNAYADRTYDDGFVNIGAGTAGSGLTTYWGYTSAGQVQGDNLVYSRSGGERRMVSGISTVAITGWGEDADTELGPYLELSYAIPVKDGLTAGFGLNFSVINTGAARVGMNTFSQTQFVDVYDVTATDTYALGGVIPPIAPYNGTYAGPGPLINNIPSSRVFQETMSGSQRANFLDNVSESFDLDLYTIGVGGQVAWWPCPHCFLRAEGGVSLNLADWQARRDESILQAIDRGPYVPIYRQVLGSGHNELLFGLYLQAAVGWQIDERWSVQAFGRYDWNESISGVVGTTPFSVDLDGWSAGIAVGYRF